jgi:hypothetical protein
VSCRAVALTLGAALLLASAARADSLDPKVKLTKADQATAKASVLRFNDLGAAWSGGAVKPQSLKIPLCPANQPNDSDLVITGHAESTLALPSQGLQVDSDVEILKTAKQAETLASRILRPSLPGCLTYDLLRSGLAGAQATISRVAKLPVVAVGARIALYRIGLSVPTGGRHVGVDSDYLFLTKGRTEFFVNVIAPADLASQLPSFENHIATTLAGRGT